MTKDVRPSVLCPLLIFLPHLLAQVKNNSTFAADSFKPNFKFIQL